MEDIKFRPDAALSIACQCRRVAITVCDGHSSHQARTCGMVDLSQTHKCCLGEAAAAKTEALGALSIYPPSKLCGGQQQRERSRIASGDGGRIRPLQGQLLDGFIVLGRARLHEGTHDLRGARGGGSQWRVQ